MPDIHALRWRLVDAPNSLGARYRLRRWELFEQQFADIARMSVIDLGGRVETWRRARIRPCHVHIVTIDEPGADIPSWAEVDRADACELPSRIKSRHYDLAYSNSVMEHVGGHARRMAFAEAIRTLADRHWVQTPYRYFPVEPHWLFPWFQHLPVAARAFIAPRWPLVHTRSRAGKNPVQSVMGVELLSRTELRSYFPESRIVAERVGPLVKSIIAVKT